MINIIFKRPADKIERKVYKHLYYICSNMKRVGEIEFKKCNRYIILSDIIIYDEYKRNGYGESAVLYLLNNYKVFGIIGECINSKEGIRFWNYIIKKYGGKKYDTTYCRNTCWSFVVSTIKEKINIDNEYLSDVLRISYWL